MSLIIKLCRTKVKSCYRRIYLFAAGPPKILTLLTSSPFFPVLSAGFGCGGAFVPLLPGVPVKDFLPRALPGLRCGLAIVAMFPELVAPAVAAE